jgi:tetratricopeptide (TPR) repeat protein
VSLLTGGRSSQHYAIVTTETEQTTEPEVKSSIILCPGLVALVALVLYGVTVNHWVSFGSLPFASQLMGWDWHPGPLPWRPDPQYHPLNLILTFPLRLLPMGWRPLALNVFSAVCAALTLGILARSVTLLSHDRTKEERKRVFLQLFAYINSLIAHDRNNEQRLEEGGKFAQLSVRAAFLPAVLAVLLLATQLTFWQNAVSGTGEMIDLLVLAFLILCLLEFRVSQRDRQLYVFAFVYGLGVANNWALIGFFPCFFGALIWVKRAGFFHPVAEDENARSPNMSEGAIARLWIKEHIGAFNLKFVLGMTGWGVLGLLLYGLVPLLGAARNDGSFWELLRQRLSEQHLYLFRFSRYYALIAGVPTLIPLLCAAINWPSLDLEFRVDTEAVTRVLFRVVYLVFLAAGVLMFFDVKLSPSPRNMGLGVITGAPDLLSFYYLAALSVGYLSGRVLLVSGKDVAYRWGEPVLLRALNVAVVGLLWLGAIVLPALLFCENYAHIRDSNSPALDQFGKEMAKSLPSKPAIVLADHPTLLYLAMGASQRLGLPDQYTFIESRELLHGEYLDYLVDRYPSFRKLVISDRFPEEITPEQVGDLLAHLAAQQPVYYLHPSFGSYFERICMTPQRLGGYVHPHPTNALATWLLSTSQIATNQAFWHAMEKDSLASLEQLANRSGDARRIANFYSQMLDYWGTELQKSATELKLSPVLKEAMLKDAKDQFAQAVRLNPKNMMARANQEYDEYWHGAPTVAPLTNAPNLASQFPNHWDVPLILFGPADVPGLDTQIGRYFAERGDYLQAAHLFQRCLELAPKDSEGELDLAKAYIDLGRADAALNLIREMRGRSAGNPLELLRVEALAYAAKNDFAQADKLLTDEHQRIPKDYRFTSMMAEFYRLMGYGVLRKSRGDPAKQETADKDAAIWFEKALTALDERLQLLNSPAANALEVSNINLRKAEIQMTMKNYEAAIITLTAMLRQDPKDPVPLLNRAISEFHVNRLDAAKNDYQALEKMVPEPSQSVYYGLAQVAQKQNDKAAEIHYDKLFLKYSPRHTPGVTNVTQRLHKLESQ